MQDTVADEGMTAQRILFTGTRSGPFRGLPRTGREVRFSGIEINRMADAKVAEPGSNWTRSGSSSNSACT